MIWQIDRPPGDRDRQILQAARALDATWLFLPARVPTAILEQWSVLINPSDELIVGVDSDDLVAARLQALKGRLDALRQPRCAAVMLQERAARFAESRATVSSDAPAAGCGAHAVFVP